LCYMTTIHHTPTHTILRPTNPMDEKVSSSDYDRPRPQINKHDRHAGATNCTLCFSL